MKESPRPAQAELRRERESARAKAEKQLLAVEGRLARENRWRGIDLTCIARMLRYEERLDVDPLTNELLDGASLGIEAWINDGPVVDVPIPSADGSTEDGAPHTESVHEEPSSTASESGVTDSAFQASGDPLFSWVCPAVPQLLRPAHAGRRRAPAPICGARSRATRSAAVCVAARGELLLLVGARRPEDHHRDHRGRRQDRRRQQQPRPAGLRLHSQRDLVAEAGAPADRHLGALAVRSFEIPSEIRTPLRIPDAAGQWWTGRRGQAGWYRARGQGTGVVLAPAYEPRDPQQAVLAPLVRQWWPRHLESVEADGGTVPAFVRRAVDHFLACGDPNAASSR